MDAENTLKNDLEQAQVALNAGDIKRAVKSCGASITFINKHTELLKSNCELVEKTKFILTECYNAISEKNIAETEWYKKLKLSAALGMGYGELGWIYQQLEKWEEAIDLMNRALEFNDLPEENLNTLYYNLGVCYEEIGDLKKALQSLKKAIEINPNDADALFNLGMFSGKLKQFSDAVSAFERYLKIDSISEQADHVRETLQVTKRAIERLKMATQLVENLKYKDVGDIINMSLTLVRERQSDLAIAILKSSLFHKEISLEDRIAAHICLAQALSIGWAPIDELKEIFNQYEINEIASNLDMAAHLYDNF